MSNGYTPSDWYWQAEDGRLFSSAKAALVADTSAGYVAWAGDDRKPTVWPRDDAGEQTTASLQDVLSPLGLFASIDMLKVDLKTRVDDQAESLRLKLITPGAGQAMEYQEVQTQAFAAQAASDKATAEAYPMLAATIGIDVDPQTGAPATDVLGVARAAIAAYSTWATAAAAIRKARMAGKAAIDAATTTAEAQAAEAEIAWPSLG